eukprot:CAMPEP_0167789058 /NCGR_PEP_ID=MMETSP0111_2-20121227/10444_1 /TAXON_ID=91324 /ORGANISM="Lotharella globosa, Strain CCCM811" /LENGTH=390 /DNA_ID=CAMNT_0007681123 /DNA_START=62 /DNA_END=1234 /DNA_ORIENTATION=+
MSATKPGSPRPEEVIVALQRQLAACQRQNNTKAEDFGKSSLSQNDKKGAFKRKDAVFREKVEKNGKFPPESGRYVLYVSYACPWASRCLAVLHLKGLAKHIEVCSVHPTWQRTRPADASDAHAGWVFVDPDKKDLELHNSAGWGKYGVGSNLTKDTVNNLPTIRDVYETQKGKSTHTFSVPVFWDKKTNYIVCNESSIIIEFLNSEFNDLEGVNKSLDLSPSHLQAKVDETNAWVYPTINNGVYRCGFAKSQEAYEEAFYQLFDSLDRVDDILSKSRYICGDQLTMADIRLFVTIIRFDEVYAVYFKTNGKLIREYPNILGWTRELYQMQPIQKSVDFWHIKTHYYTSHPNLNLYGVVPMGPRGLKANRKRNRVDDIFLVPHGREKFASK